jgi:hypothetical protein
VRLAGLQSLDALLVDVVADDFVADLDGSSMQER